MEQLNDFNESQEGVVDLQESEQAETTETEQSEVVTAPAETKPVQTPEENAKFAEIRRKYEAEAEAKAQAKADALIAEMYGDQGIFTEADYKRALMEQEAESKGLTPEEYEAMQIGMTAKQKEAQKQADIDGIIELAEKEGFNVSEIPEEVLAQWNNGEGGRLVEIYKNHTLTAKERTYQEKLSEMEKKLAEYEKALGIRQVNTENAEASTGGVSANGGNAGELTEEMIENMSPKELNARWDEVKKIYKMR